MKPDRNDPVFLAWAAGFFDGEGCVEISHHCGSKRKLSRGSVYFYSRDNYSMSVTVSQCEQSPILLFVEAFGGHMCQIHRPKQNIRHRDIWTWRCNSAEAESFLRLVLPSLVVKRQQAEIALEFRATFGANPRSAGISEETRSARRAFQSKLRAARS